MDLDKRQLSGNSHDRLAAIGDALIDLDPMDAASFLSQSGEIIARLLPAQWVEFVTGDAVPEQAGGEDAHVQRGAAGDVLTIMVPLPSTADAMVVTRAPGEGFSGDDIETARCAARWATTLAERSATAADQRRLVDRMVSAIAHDLGNVFTPLKGRIDMIRRRAQREERARDVEDALEAGRIVTRANLTVMNMADAVRAEGTSFSGVPAPLPVQRLVEEALDVASTHSVDALIEVPDDLTALADPARARQALAIVLAGALRHTRGDSPVRVCARTAESRGHPAVEIEISDDGESVQPGEVEALFERFSTRSRAKGLGGGMYLARSIVRAQGGSLEVRVAGDTGMICVVELPAPTA